MKGNHIEIKGSELTICSKKAPLFIRLVLTLFMSVLVLIPICPYRLHLAFWRGSDYRNCVFLSFLLGTRLLSASNNSLEFLWARNTEFRS